MKLILLFVISYFLISINTVTAQIFESRADIIAELETEYKTGETENGTKFIYYDTEYTTEPSGEFTQRRYVYFTTMDDGKEICHMWKLMEPASETNTNVSYLKKRYVELEYMQWKDYEREVIYNIEVKDGICTTWVWYDNEK